MILLLQEDFFFSFSNGKWQKHKYAEIFSIFVIK